MFLSHSLVLIEEFPFLYHLCCFKIQVWNRVRNRIDEATHVCTSA